MLRSIPYLFALLVLTLASCKKEAGEDFITESDIIGSWAVASFDNDYRVSGTYSGREVNESGSSAISDSDLQFEFDPNGSWRSSGTYTVTVTTADDRQIGQHDGMGSGNWSFRQDTLFLTGLITYNETGFFREQQPLALTAFQKERSLDFVTRLDATETDAELNINLRTRSDYKIALQR